MAANNTSATIVTIENEAAANKIIDVINDNEVKRLIPSIVYTFMLLFVGVPGNCIVLYVYYFKWRGCNAKYFIFTIALFDCVNCTIGLPTEIVIMLNIYKFDNPVVCKLSRFTTFTMNSATSVILLIVAIDRFIRIFRPTFKTMSNVLAVRLCIFSIVLAMFSTSASLMLYGTFTQQKVIQGTKVVLKMCLIDNKMVSRSLGFFIGFFSILFIIGIAVTVLYILIGIEIWKRNLPPIPPSADGQQTKKRMCTNITSDNPSPGPSTQTEHIKPMILNRRMSKSKHSTFILFLITVVFYMSYVPYFALALIRTADPTFGKAFTASQDMMYQLFLRSYLLSSAVNPVINTYFSTEFRQKAKTIFKLRWSRKRRSNKT